MIDEKEKLALIMKLTQVNAQLLKSNDRRLSTHGISFSEYMILLELSKAPNHTMRRIDLAQQVSLSASGITRILNPMEKLKMVEKESNPRDARVSLVKLTAAGLQVQQESELSLAENATTLLEGVDLKAIDKVYALLNGLAKNL